MSDRRTTTVLVTGGGGYIGSHCIFSLLESGYEVVAMDNFINCVEGEQKPECLHRIEDMTGKKVAFYVADLCDMDSMRRPFEKHSLAAVIHFASLKAVEESYRQPLRYYTNNVAGTCNLLRLMEEYKVFKLVFSSSATVYGPPKYLPIDENHPTGNCANPYGRSKFILEEIIKDVCVANKKWAVTMLRYFNPVGNHPSGKIGEDPLGVPNNLMPFIAQVAVGRRDKLNVFGSDYDTVDGTGVRDYIHIMDLVEGHVAALFKLQAEEFCGGCNVYNLGTGKGCSVLEMVKAFENATGVKIPITFASRRTGDVASMYASCDLAEKEIGFKATRTLFDMCRDTWNWQSQNPQGYSKL